MHLSTEEKIIDVSTALRQLQPAELEPVRLDIREIDQSLWNASAQPRRRWYSPVKFIFEWVFSSMLLVLISPLLLLLAVLVKWTSPGPVFYAQTRLGRAGRLYRIFKLRTMHHNAESRSGPVWAAKNDVRITPLGRFLRDTHLDELPQLWNVVCGDMALIGPRPERPEIASRIATHVPDFYHRLRVRPGVTGFAQMLLPADDPNDANYVGLRRKLAHDLFYIREVGPEIDLRIATSTFVYFISAVTNVIVRRLLRSYVGMMDQPLAKMNEIQGKERVEHALEKGVA